MFLSISRIQRNWKSFFFFTGTEYYTILLRAIMLPKSDIFFHDALQASNNNNDNDDEIRSCCVHFYSFCSLYDFVSLQLTKYNADLHEMFSFACNVHRGTHCESLWTAEHLNSESCLCSSICLSQIPLRENPTEHSAIGFQIRANPVPATLMQWCECLTYRNTNHHESCAPVFTAETEDSRTPKLA